MRPMKFDSWAERMARDPTGTVLRSLVQALILGFLVSLVILYTGK